MGDLAGKAATAVLRGALQEIGGQAVKAGLRQVKPTNMSAAVAPAASTSTTHTVANPLDGTPLTIKTDVL